jgi:hypothetical protein
MCIASHLPTPRYDLGCARPTGERIRGNKRALPIGRARSGVWGGHQARDRRTLANCRFRVACALIPAGVEASKAWSCRPTIEASSQPLLLPVPPAPSRRARLPLAAVPCQLESPRQARRSPSLRATGHPPHGPPGAVPRMFECRPCQPARVPVPVPAWVAAAWL